MLRAHAQQHLVGTGGGCQVQRRALDAKLPARGRAAQQVHGGRADEGGHVGVGRAVVDIVRRAQLLHHAALHHRNARAQRHRLDLVVRDVHAGDAAGLVQPLDFGAHLHAQLGVQVGQRLVKQEELRLARQRPPHGHALALAARELAGPAVQQVADLQHGRHFVDALLALGLGHLAHLQRKADVVGHAHGGVERVALEHHGNVAVTRGHAHHVLAADAHFALGGRIQPGNDVEQRGLAAARGPDQDEELARCHVDVHLVQHLHAFVALAEALVDACDLK